MFPVSAAAVIRELGTRRGGGGGEYRSQELSLGHRGEAELTSLDLADLLSSTLPPLSSFPTPLFYAMYVHVVVTMYTRFTYAKNYVIRS